MEIRVQVNNTSTSAQVQCTTVHVESTSHCIILKVLPVCPNRQLIPVVVILSLSSKTVLSFKWHKVHLKGNDMWGELLYKLYILNDIRVMLIIHISVSKTLIFASELLPMILILLFV